MKQNKKPARAVPVKNTTAKPIAPKPAPVKADAAPEKQALSPEKLRLFKWLSVFFPIVLIVFLELVLRLFGYGHDTSLFIKYPPDENYMVMNHYASTVFFPDTAFATTGNQEIFAVNKAPNTIRIFVLGESTTIGFPFRPNGSFHRWLQYRLSHMYPDKNFEIINLSLTAVNSYTVLDFGKQLAQYNPDAVLIYIGHNEYYGALGVGSTTYVGSNRSLVQTLIWLRQFRVVQLINNIIDKVKHLFAAESKADSRTLMEVMAARQHIVYGSKDYQAGIDQFTANMTELCQTLNSEKIPTFLSTVESNEKDMPPFISDGDGPNSANGYFNAGQTAFKDSSFTVAKQDFDKAKELDQLRFRAPDAINAEVVKLTQQFPDVHLVDTKKYFEQHSPHGIIGSELDMEHVHPNLLGYAVMSDAFYHSIQQQHIIKDKPEQEYTLDRLRREMPITTVDTLNGTYLIMMLKTGFPFNQPIPADFRIPNTFDADIAGKVARNYLIWPAAMGQVFTYDRKNNNYAGQQKIAEAMILQYPQIPDFYKYAANFNEKSGNYGLAAFYFRKLFMLNHDSSLPPAILKLYLKADEPVPALAFSNGAAIEQKADEATLKEIITDEARLKTQPGDKTLMEQITADYKKIGVDTVKLKN